MKNLLFCFLLFWGYCFSQNHNLSVSNSIYLPVLQRSEVLFGNCESGSIEFIPSSYFGGLNYDYQFKNSPWIFTGSIAVGFEKYTISTYNELINFAQFPNLKEDFEGLSSSYQSYIYSVGAGRKIVFKKWFDELTFSTGIYVNQRLEYSGARKFRINMTPELDGQTYFTSTYVFLTQTKKNGVGLQLGLSLRKNLGNRFYVQLFVRSMLRNSFEYSYDLNYYKKNTNGSDYQEYSSQNQGNKINYGLVGLHLNVGFKW